MNWIDSLSDAISFIENNLTSDIGIVDVANYAYSSGSNFQRIFCLVTGMTIGDYIRNRRLSLAGQDLLNTDDRIIDIALRYQYDTQESFSKAFTRLYGKAPSVVRRQRRPLKVFRPLTINIKIKGGFLMSSETEYRRIADGVQETLPGEIIRKDEITADLAEPPFSFTVTTTRSGGSEKYCLQGATWAVERPSPDEIAAMLSGLSAPINTFAILTVNDGYRVSKDGNSGSYIPSEEVGNCSYIQTAIIDEDSGYGKNLIGEGCYVIEAQFIYNWDEAKGPDNPDFKQKQYRKFAVSISEVQEIFLAFASGVAPNISSWIDVSKEMGFEK